MNKIVLTALVLAAALTAQAGCGVKDKVNDEASEPVSEMETLQPEENTTSAWEGMEETVNAEITMKSGGVIKLELYHDVAPITVENFVKLANDGFYDGLTFHRIIPGFMIQGGDPEGRGSGGPGYSIKGEFAANGVENNLKHERGVISMARANDPNSAGSQFFIMHEDADYLDGNYAAFGRVTDGMEVVDEIAETQTDMNDMPLTPQVIDTIRIIEDSED